MTGNYKVITETPGWLNRMLGDGVPDSNATLYGKVPYLFRVVQIRCDTLAGIPIRFFVDGKDEEKETEWPYPTPIQHLVWRWEASNLLAGAAYGEIVSNPAGYKKDVIYRNPFDMQVTYEDGVLVFKQHSSGTEWRNDFRAGKYEMVYFAEYDPSQDLLPGIGSGKAANMDAKLLYALAKFPEMYFEGGAMPVTLLGIDSTDKGEITRVQEWFKRSATTIRNAFRVLGIRAGSITPTTLTPPLKDLQMPELSDGAKHNISVAFGVPKTMLDSEAANYATAKEDRKSYYEETIMPRARMFESVLNTQLLEREGMRVEFMFNELDLFQEDEGERAQLLLNLVQAGLPLELALEQAGYDLTEEQAAMLESKPVEIDKPEPDEQPDEMKEELGKWMRFAEKRIKDGKSIREFESDIIPKALHSAISGALETAKSADEVRYLFANVIDWQGYP